MILLDTNVVSGLMRPAADAALERWILAIRDESFAVSTISVAEMAFGLERLPDGRRKTALTTAAEGLFQAMDIVDFDADMAARSGALRARREHAGRPMSFADSLIAGAAAQLGATLASRNTADFAGLDLSLVDPWRS